MFLCHCGHIALLLHIYFSVYAKYSSGKPQKHKEKTHHRLKSLCLTHFALERLVSDSQLYIRTGFAAALLCRLWGHVGRNKDERCASAGTAHHCAAQCKDATDGHHNYVYPLFFFNRSASGNTIVKERCSSATTTLPHVVTGRAAGREATAETCQALSLSVF